LLAASSSSRRRRRRRWRRWRKKTATPPTLGLGPHPLGLAIIGVD
jgi:hypothetical protein